MSDACVSTASPMAADAALLSVGRKTPTAVERWVPAITPAPRTESKPCEPLIPWQKGRVSAGKERGLESFLSVAMGIGEPSKDRRVGFLIRLCR